MFKSKAISYIRTLESGKIRLNLVGGDTFFLAPNTEIHFNKTDCKRFGKNQQSNTAAQRQIAGPYVRKNATASVQIRTPNVLVGVKGTEFDVEFLKKATNVRTLNKCSKFEIVSKW